MSGDYGFARPHAVERKEQDVSTCATCRHWTRGEPYTVRGEVMLELPNTQGQCRGGPPSVSVSNGEFMSLFPATHEWETCGAYSPRVPDEGGDVSHD